jgi:hypothetical protein
VRRGKTGKLVRFRIEGTLKVVLERILASTKAVSSVYLIADERGQPVNIDNLEKRFLRPAARRRGSFGTSGQGVTDENDLRTASQRAGHADEKITAEVYRRIKGRSGFAAGLGTD